MYLRYLSYLVTHVINAAPIRSRYTSPFCASVNDTVISTTRYTGTPRGHAVRILNAPYCRRAIPNDWLFRSTVSSQAEENRLRFRNKIRLWNRSWPITWGCGVSLPVDLLFSNGATCVRLTLLPHDRQSRIPRVSRERADLDRRTHQRTFSHPQDRRGQFTVNRRPTRSQSAAAKGRIVRASGRPRPRCRSESWQGSVRGNARSIIP